MNNNVLNLVISGIPSIHKGVVIIVLVFVF